MFLNERALRFVESMRINEKRDYLTHKDSIADAMSVIATFIDELSDDDWRKIAVLNALNTLSTYNYLLTELSKEK